MHKVIRIFLTLLYEQCFRSALLCVNPKWTICFLAAAIFGGEGDNLIAFKSRVSTNLSCLILSMDERNNGKCQNETSEYIAQLLYKHKYDLFFRYIGQNFLVRFEHCCLYSILCPKHPPNFSFLRCHYMRMLSKTEFLLKIGTHCPYLAKRLGSWRHG